MGPKRNRLLIAIAIFALAFQCISGMAEARRYDEAKERSFARRQKRALRDAEEAFLRGDYRSAARICDDLLYIAHKYKGRKKYLIKIYYYGGIAHLKLNNISKAKAHLGTIVSDYRRSDIIADAYAALAEAYYKDGDYAKAGELLRHYLRNYPLNPSAVQAYFKLGQVAQKEGRWEEAKYYFDKVKKDFPMSFEAQLIPQVSDIEDFSFAVQLGSFKSLENARGLKARLKKKGYSPYIVEVRSSQSLFYRVRTGRLRSRIDAQSLADKLKRDGFEARIHP